METSGSESSERVDDAVFDLFGLEAFLGNGNLEDSAASFFNSELMSSFLTPDPAMTFGMTGTSDEPFDLDFRIFWIRIIFLFGSEFLLAFQPVGSHHPIV